MAFCLQEGKDLQDLALPQMQGVSSLIEEDVYEVLELEHVVNARDSYGGTAQAQVEAQIAEARAALAGEVLVDQGLAFRRIDAQCPKTRSKT